MFLTKRGGLFVGPVSRLLGLVINFIYNFFSGFGIENVALTIVLFTVFVRLLIFPLNVNTTKSGKISNYIQPEIDKVTKKYRGKKDQESMMAMQNESNAIRKKYGVSMTGGCLPLLLQFPIIISLFSVTQNIPAYIVKIKALYQPIADAIFADADAGHKLEEFKNTVKSLKTVSLSLGDKNTIIDVLAKFSSDNWNEYSQLVGNGAVSDAINGNVDKINHVYSFIGGLNITTAYGLAISIALIVPIIATVFQILLTVTTPQQQSSDPTQQATANMMKKVSIFFSVAYFFICALSPLSFGLYFATTAVCSFLLTTGTNIYFSKCDMEKIVKKSMEKAKKKEEKRIASGKKTFMERMQEAAEAGGQQTSASTSSNISKNVATTNLKNYESKTSANSQYRAGSLASKANAMQRYNEGNNGGKK